MLDFLPGYGVFAAAGAVAAAGPVLIHLLNRRRFRVVNWGAMQFLLEALQRNRRILQIRDLVLLALRTAAVLLFGLALARPYFTMGGDASDPRKPVHAIVVVDNSLSMNYERLGGTLLAEAKAKALEFLEDLPDGSLTTIIPLCGSAAGSTLAPYRNKEDARDALDRIEAVDRGGTIVEAADLAQRASKLAPEIPAKRVVFLSDQQKSIWPADAAIALKGLTDLQVVDFSTQDAENTWVADLSILDGIADVETSTTFVATIRHQGPAPRTGVQVTLTVDGAEVGTRTVDIEPGQSLPVTFTHRFDGAVEPGRPAFVPAEVKISPDRLPLDDSRALVVPVVAALKVVFVDQYGELEKPEENRYGDSFLLRRLLVPVTSRTGDTKSLVHIQRTTTDDLTREVLEDARLVVVAGAATPGAAAPLLREYVLQGGQLFISASGDFDPASWDNFAWLDGGGILPTPLSAEPVGGQEGAVPLYIDFKSLLHDYFLLPEESPEGLEELYRRPVFIRAVQVTADDATLAEIKTADAARYRENLKLLAESDANRQKWAALEAKKELSESDREARDQDERRRAEIEPHWLLWDSQRDDSPTGAGAALDEAALDKLAAQLADHSQPRVLARLEGGAPLLVERSLGRGRVAFLASGVSGSPADSWNSLAQTDAMLLFDRIFRAWLESTLPQRNFASVKQVTLPIRGSDRRARFELVRPGGAMEDLVPEAIEADTYGLTLRDVLRRGLYSVSARPAEGHSTSEEATKLWETTIAINGTDGARSGADRQSESELTPIDEAGLRERLEGVSYRWTPRSEAIQVQGSQVAGQDLWWYLLFLVLLLLLVEMAVLAWPTIRPPVVQTASFPGTAPARA